MFSVMSSAVGAASKAATGAFSTLKDVYHTLQAKNTVSIEGSSLLCPYRLSRIIIVLLLSLGHKYTI